jgi:hypothetical protein
MQFKYDSLLTAGYTQSSAISAILPNQNINYSTISINAGQYPFSLQPNAVCLFKINIPGISSVAENNIETHNFTIYPNPTSTSLTISYSSQQIIKDRIQIYNSMGALVKTVDPKQSSTVIDVSELASGLYIVRLKNYPQQTVKFIKQ